MGVLSQKLFQLPFNTDSAAQFAVHGATEECDIAVPPRMGYSTPCPLYVVEMLRRICKELVDDTGDGAHDIDRGPESLLGE